jgi:hypothetical protein
MISVEEFQARTEQMHAANVARIKTLMADAEQKWFDAPSRDQAQYWRGFADGLKRTLRVLDGHG